MKLRSSLLAGAAALLFSFSALKQGELRDITKPYLGVYECTQASLSEEDILSRLDDLKLELKDKGQYVLYYKEKGAKTKKVTGKYRYNNQSETLTLCVKGSPFFRRSFPMRKGVLTVTVPYGQKTLRLQFEQK